MNRILIIALAALVVAVTWIGFSQKSLVTTRSLFDFFDNVDTGEISQEDLRAELYYVIVDEEGREITITGRKIHVGDEYLTADNKLYRVFRVNGRTAHARFIREIGAFFDHEPDGIFVLLWQRLSGVVKPVQKNQEKDENKEKKEKDKGKAEEAELEPEEEPKQLIGIYHTHNAESYIPTDGTDSINGEGGIHAVGDSFASALEAKGITVMHNKTLHLPHDRGAYRRSRVTVEELLEKGPDVIFDIHRDATPRHVYAAEIDGEAVTQVQIVVGRQNPNMRVTKQFALDIKKTADEVKPGLVKGIFMARGSYNQDLTPMNLLLEVGAHTNSREAAEAGIALFADVVSFYFYGDEDPGEKAAPAPGQGPTQGPGGQTQPGIQAATRNIYFLLAITMVIVVGFLILNAGTMDDIRFKLAPYFERARPYTAKGDRFLSPIQDKIRHTSLLVGTKAVVGLEAGDGALIPLAERIRVIALTLGEKGGVALENGDRYIAYWQEKIRDSALTIKEKAEALRNRKKLR